VVNLQEQVNTGDCISRAVATGSSHAHARTPHTATLATGICTAFLDEQRQNTDKTRVHRRYIPSLYRRWRRQVFCKTLPNRNPMLACQTETRHRRESQ